MIAKEELEKLTVLQLKEKLKSRKLVMSGTKPELITRLYDNMVAEEDLLADSAGLEGNDSAGPTEFDLSNVDLDEVLGMESDLLSPHDEKKQQPETSESVVKTTQPTPKSPQKTDAPKTESSTKTPILAPGATATTNSSTKKTILPPQKAQSAVEKKPENGAAKTAETARDETSTDEKKGSGLSAEEGQKLLLISKKLGLPCKNASGGDAESEDALAKRTKRFGPVNEEEGKKQNRLDRFGLIAPPSVDEKVAKRIQRFGAVAEEESAKKKSRQDRFGGAVATGGKVVDEKMQKRAERFGAK